MLKEEIEKCREELNNLLTSESNYNEILSKSQELDTLIAKAQMDLKNEKERRNSRMDRNSNPTYINVRMKSPFRQKLLKAAHDKAIEEDKDFTEVIIGLLENYTGITRTKKSKTARKAQP